MKHSHDLTTGSLALHYRKLAVPLAIGMVFSTLYNVVDVFFAGLISTDAQAGLAISFQAFFIFVTVGFGLSAAMTALVGNAIGRKDDDEASRIALQGVSFAGLSAIILLVAAFAFTPSLLTLISTDGAYRDAGLRYMMILILSLPSFVIAYGLNGILQASGDTVSMQRALIGAFFVNLGLNPILVFGIPPIFDGFGFIGIAAATVISQSGVMLYIARQVWRCGLCRNDKLRALIPDLSIYRLIFIQLLPTTFTMLVMFSAGFIVQIYLKEFGPAAVAAYGVALRVEQLFLLPVFGLTGALLPIASQNFGAGEAARVREALFTCWKFGWILMCIACPILFFAAPLLMRSFTPDPAVIDIGVSYLRVDGFILPIYMMLFAINSFLQALKKPIWTLIIGIYRQAFGVAFFSYLFAFVFGFGVIGVWFGIATSVLSGLILSLLLAHHASKPLIGGLFMRPREAS
jgi:putative MATE family efflux protein